MQKPDDVTAESAAAARMAPNLFHHSGYLFYRASLFRNSFASRLAAINRHTGDDLRTLHSVRLLPGLYESEPQPQLFHHVQPEPL